MVPESGSYFLTQAGEAVSVRMKLGSEIGKIQMLPSPQPLTS